MESIIKNRLDAMQIQIDLLVETNKYYQNMDIEGRLFLLQVEVQNQAINIERLDREIAENTRDCARQHNEMIHVIQCCHANNMTTLGLIQHDIQENKPAVKHKRATFFDDESSGCSNTDKKSRF